MVLIKVFFVIAACSLNQAQLLNPNTFASHSFGNRVEGKSFKSISCTRTSKITKVTFYLEQAIGFLSLHIRCLHFSLNPQPLKQLLKLSAETTQE